MLLLERLPPMKIHHRCLASLVSAPCFALLSCSSDDKPSNGLDGTNGGSVASSGVLGAGGRVTSGGAATANGGVSTASGGVLASAGTGGAAAGMGGAATNNGGNATSGDGAATGGGTSMGGTATGGVAAGSGGAVASTGGSAAGGAMTSTGGTLATGEPEFHVYLALGQSNMQGAGHLPDEPVFHPRVKALQGQNCSEHQFPYGEWRDQFQPMIRCREGTRPKADGTMAPIGLSPSDTFAVTMAEAAGSNVTIGIVGAAYGGTDIQAHLPDCGNFCKPPFGDISGAPVVNGTTPIYPWILDLAKKAQKVGTIKGIIFHHGENNSGDSTWLVHVGTYIRSLRKDLGLNAADVPFIAGELPRTGCCAGHNKLVQQIPDYVENGHWVSSGPMDDGTVLVDRGDSLHWSTFSVMEMGKRYAAKMLELHQ